MAGLNTPLSDAEYARVALLVLGRSKQVTNLEMLDGFFAALIVTACARLGYARDLDALQADKLGATG